MSIEFSIDRLIAGIAEIFPGLRQAPWLLIGDLPAVLNEMINSLDDEYHINEGVAIHKTVTMEQSVVLKAPVIIGPHCFLAAYAYLRGGVYLGSHTTIGPGCEVKSSIIAGHTALAH